MSKDLARLALHKVYVPDFVDTSGRRIASGCYFSASFSKLLAENAKKVAIISRVDVHRYLDQHGWSDSELSNANVMSKLVSEFGVDGFLSGIISADQNSYTIDFTVRDSTGKELFRTRYIEKADPFVTSNIPVGTELSASNFHFAGLDGVTMPKCVYCPLPSFPSAKGASGVRGSIMLSVLVTPEGKADHIYLARQLNPNLDRDAVETVKSWHFEPSKDPSGSIVAVRVPVEVTYTAY